METKICCRCKKEKSAIEFTKDKRKKSGLTYDCSECRYLKKMSNPERMLKDCQKYRLKNKHKIDARRNSPEGKAWQKEYRIKNREKRLKDPILRLAHNMRSRLRETLGQKKSKKTFDLVGCDLNFLKNHLESQFQLGMTWENYGKWHVDHKYPLSLAKSKEDIQKLCHYSNLQPLWAIDNWRKHNKVA